MRFRLPESSEDDTYAFYQDICAGGFSGPYSLLAFHKPSGRLAGIALNQLKEYTHAGPQARRKSALAASKVDYAEGRRYRPLKCVGVNFILGVCRADNQVTTTSVV